MTLSANATGQMRHRSSKESWPRNRHSDTKCMQSKEIRGNPSRRATADIVGSKSQIRASGRNASTSGRMAFAFDPRRRKKGALCPRS